MLAVLLKHTYVSNLVMWHLFGNSSLPFSLSFFIARGDHWKRITWSTGFRLAWAPQWPKATACSTGWSAKYRDLYASFLFSVVSICDILFCCINDWPIKFHLWGEFARAITPTDCRKQRNTCVVPFPLFSRDSLGNLLGPKNSGAEVWVAAAGWLPTRWNLLTYAGRIHGKHML